MFTETPSYTVPVHTIEGWTKAHDIAVAVTGLDPRMMKYPDPNDWAEWQSNKWFCALEAAQMAFREAASNGQDDSP